MPMGLVSLFDPTLGLVCLLVASSILTLLRRIRAGTILLHISVAVVALVSWTPLPQLIIRPLEQRFPVWHDTDDDITGIIILGGALNPTLASWRPGSGLASASGRITEGVVLARRFPHAKLLYSGGAQGVSEANIGFVLMTGLGVDPQQIAIEGRSRTTAENAKFSCQLVKPQSTETWLLVTSASHMPRAMGTFRAVGFNVQAYPVDYHSKVSSIINFDLPAGLELLRIAVKEYIGLAAYRIWGFTLELYPGHNSTSNDPPAQSSTRLKTC